jgi:DNA-binding response OmpR family regulator
MGTPRILIIEDDTAIAAVYVRALQTEGYELSVAYQGRVGLRLAEHERPHLILLDIGIPDIDGFQICRTLRTLPKLAATPILIVTGRTAIGERVAGFDSGGDDYIAKPVDIIELRARIRAHLRRVSMPAQRTFAAGIHIDHQTHTAVIEGRRVRLTLREQELLSYFIQHEGVALTNSQLIRAVWGYAPEHADPGIVRWQIGALRKRIEPNPKHPRYIHTVKQRGYLYQDAQKTEAGGASDMS